MKVSVVVIDDKAFLDIKSGFPRKLDDLMMCKDVPVGANGPSRNCPGGSYVSPQISGQQAVT